MVTRVVHIKDNVPGAIYIGRAMPRQGLKASKWANPYKLGKAYSRLQAIDQFLRDLFRGDRSRHLLAELPGLRGKPLACWCRHDGEERAESNTCHGDVLVFLLETHTDDELIAMAKGGDHA